MRTIIIDNDSSYIDELKELLNTYKPVVIGYNQLQNIEINPEDLVVLSGGHRFSVLRHDKEYGQEINLIKDHKGPIVGICLGFQLIAHTFGSSLHLLDNRRKGSVDIEAVVKNNIITGKAKVPVYESHNWSVPKVNPPLQALAKSGDGVEIFRHVNRQIYGMQFHPEKTKGTLGRVLFKNILKELLQ